MQKQYLSSKNRNHLQQMKGHGSQLMPILILMTWVTGILPEDSCTDHFSVVQEGTAV